MTLEKDSSKKVLKGEKDERNVAMFEFLKGIFLTTFQDHELEDKEAVL